jgi:hypothetical protein
MRQALRWFNDPLHPFKVTNCDLEQYSWKEHQISALRVYRILMLSSVLKSERAVQVNIQIMHAFVRLRELLTSNAELLRRLDDLEFTYDENFRVVFKAIRQLMG